MPRSRKLFYMLCPVVLAFMPVTSLPADGPAGAPGTAPTTSPIGGGARPSTTGTVVLFPATTRRVVEQLKMNFKDATIDSVLEYLANSAGFEVLRTGDVTGRVTIISPQPVNSDEALELLNSALRTQGFTSVQQGRRLKIMTVENAKKSNIPVQFGIDPDKIAENDNFITQVIPVKKVDAVKLKSDLQPLIGTNADLTANQLSNTVIITDTSANVKRMVTIIAAMDKNDPTTVDVKVVTLKYADSTTTAKLITDIFNPSESQSRNGQQQNSGNPFDQIMRIRGGGGPGGSGGPGGGSGGGRGGGGADAAGESGKASRISAVADARTNSIVITAPNETMVLIEQIIKQLDSDPTSNTSVFTYNLKNAQAITLEPVLNNLFGNSSSGGTSSSSSRRNTGSSTSGFGSTGSSGSSGGLGGTSSGRSGSSPGTGIGGSRTSSTSGFGSTGSTGFGGTGSSGSGSSNQRAASELTGQVFVVANPDTNSLLVTAATKYMDQVKKIIEDLDRPVPQVLIKVLIAEVTHNDSEDYGVDFSVLNENASGQGFKIGSTLGNAAAVSTGGLVVNLVERDFSATIRALATVGKVEVLSRPYILASDNQAANITVGQEVPFITDTRTDALGQQINTIQYQDIGIILDVTPHINPEGLVIMDVAPEISQLSTATVPISAGVNATIINKRSAQSRVAIKDGQTIVIGGLMQDNKTSTITKIPILGDIPGLGLIFQRRQTTKTKTELLIFLTPHVALQPDALKAMSQDEMKGTKLTPNAVDPGTFQDHVRGLQRGTTRPTVELPAPMLPEPEHK